MILAGVVNLYSQVKLNGLDYLKGKKKKYKILSLGNSHLIHRDQKDAWSTNKKNWNVILLGTISDSRDTAV